MKTEARFNKETNTRHLLQGPPLLDPAHLLLLSPTLCSPHSLQHVCSAQSELWHRCQQELLHCQNLLHGPQSTDPVNPVDGCWSGASVTALAPR
ncbi:hypothetical protein E2C01_012772 [Portunus trituberculatus]|uniref:Uncharacterized protein n=1 Tax=Portunus trituberculatus TaxID=210409 RepID=A0A5B7DEZ4_PORTR|nr:hypothetical protein [Portunus trituberculatus]